MRNGFVVGIVLMVCFSAAAAGEPATLVVTKRVELGPLSKASWDNSLRWGAATATADGHLLVFYCTPKRRIAYRHSADGKTFDEPVVLGPGQCPAVTVDAAGNVFVVYIGGAKQPTIRKLTRTAPGKWDAAAEASQPFKRFAAGRSNFPSLLIPPGSKRMWCMFNYQTVDIFHLPREVWYPRRKPRGQTVVSYSDDGGSSWAEPIYLGSDSGDEGSSVALLRAWGGRAAWFWAFWDCATPAWGFFDGSRCRSMREFFPHARARMAVGHPWDTATDPAGRLIFATGMGSYTNGQVCKVFDGATWSPELWISDKRAMVSLLGDGERTFVAATEGRRISLYELDGRKASRRPVLYRPPEGKSIFRPMSLATEHRPTGYLPLLLHEGTPKKSGKRVNLVDYTLTYLRLEVRPLDAAARAEAAKPVFDPAKTRNPKAYKPAPIGDDRAEPRTDTPKDRKLIRVGERRILVYADDNPGRLLAAPIESGTVGVPAVLMARPEWGRFQCAADADGDDAFVVAAGGLGGVQFVRVTGVKAWKPKVVAKTVLPLARKTGQTGWPSICRTAGGKLMIVAAVDGKLVTTISADRGASWKALPPVATAAADPKPALVVSAAGPMLLVGGDNGLWARPWDDGKWADARKIVEDAWIGHHFSATADGERVDVLYSPAASYLGKKTLGHLRLERGKWRVMPAVDGGGAIRGLSVSRLGGGKLLAIYCVRNPRPATVPKGQEKMKRFTYTLLSKTFDGKNWQAEAAKVAWPKLKTYRPANWKDWNEVGGVVYVPEVDLGRFPVLPAAGAGERVPAAWMVPGFLCMPKKNAPDRDRGGLLVVTGVTTRD